SEEDLISRVFGNTSGLKASQLKKLQVLYRRHLPPQQVISLELAQSLAEISFETKRQVGLLINRRGDLLYVIVGHDHSLLIPDLSEFRGAKGRLKGLRLLHTHFKEEALNEEDKTDLARLRLDMVTVLGLDRSGKALWLQTAHLLPDNPAGLTFRVLEPERLGQSRVEVQSLVRSLEEEWGHRLPVRRVKRSMERVMLISITHQPKSAAQESLEELKELASSANLEVVETVIQTRREINPKFLMSKDRLSSLSIRALQLEATLWVFDQELNPSQVRSITDFTDLKVIDRTQLILDIFAQRARTREGKIQVEMAQLKYILPRLVGRDDALSRLTGGIGGRGPGETRLEIDRRRVREKIHRLQRDLEAVRSQRQQRRGRRERRNIPIVSIVGYTNAGKSTLLNTLTHSHLASEDRFFATLDPTSRRLKFPHDREVIITDTVGFIKNLPKDLLTAFRATLEELENADLILQVIDISNPRFEEQMNVVENLLNQLGLSTIPSLRVFNKIDLVTREYARIQSARFQAAAVSALQEQTIGELMKRIEALIEERRANHR
ncbi:MAG TPA: GTPase HflX, partial [Thermodesulfobacteriota bacterium]|nr:GTPase HflX [Thermodesulfobacteriota bacterium]